MPGIDVIDEAVIDAQPDVICKAILDEYAGVTHWWMPYVEAKAGMNSPTGGENMISDVTVHGPLGITSRFTQKITRVEAGKSIRIDYIGGDFLGTGVYTFEPVDGKTRIRYRWEVRPNKLLLNILSPVAGKTHSGNMHKGYGLLNRYLNKSIRG